MPSRTADAPLGGDGAGLGEQPAVVSLAHVGEAGPDGQVLAAKGVLGQQIDVVRDQHQVADAKLRVRAARGVAHEERVDAQGVHDADGESDLAHGVALVVVETPLKRHDGTPAEVAENQAALMALDGGDGKMRHVGIGERVGDVDFPGEATESRAQHDGYTGAQTGAGAQPVSGFLDSF